MGMIKRDMINREAAALFNALEVGSKVQTLLVASSDIPCLQLL